MCAKLSITGVAASVHTFPEIQPLLIIERASIPKNWGIRVQAR